LHGLDFLGIPAKDQIVNAVLAIAHERFAAEFEQYSFVSELCHNRFVSTTKIPNRFGI
jgi:hypothetical protein